MHATEIHHLDFLVVIFAVNVPKSEFDRGAVNRHGFLVNLDANRGVIFVEEDSFNETADEAGLADGEGTEHADFLRDHGNRRPVYGATGEMST